MRFFIWNTFDDDWFFYIVAIILSIFYSSSMFIPLVLSTVFFGAETKSTVDSSLNLPLKVVGEVVFNPVLSLYSSQH